VTDHSPPGWEVTAVPAVSTDNTRCHG
jgi:hypothetical protein